MARTTASFSLQKKAGIATKATSAVAKATLATILLVIALATTACAGQNNSGQSDAAASSDSAEHASISSNAEQSEASGSVAAASGNTAEAESSDDNASAMLAAYSEVVSQYIDDYGPQDVFKTNDGRSYLSGLAFARLIDFNHDGSDELFLVRCDSNHLSSSAQLEANREAYTAEVWAYENGQAARVYEGRPRIGEVMTVQFALYESADPGEPSVVQAGVMSENSIDIAYYSYSGNGPFSIEHEIGTSSAGTVTTSYVDGRKADDDSYSAIIEMYGSPPYTETVYSLSDSADSPGLDDKLFTITEQTLEALSVDR